MELENFNETLQVKAGNDHFAIGRACPCQLIFIRACKLILFTSISHYTIEQRKAMLLQIDTLKSSLENKTSTYITITSIILYYVFNLDQGHNRMEKK